MEEKKELKISLKAAIIVVLILVVAFGVVLYCLVNNDNLEKGNEVVSSDVTNYKNEGNFDLENDENAKDYIALYYGREMPTIPGIHNNIIEMDINEDNNKKYNTEYYNYEEGKSKGKITGIFGREGAFEGTSYVEDASKIAISKEYNAIPREYTKINELPEELNDLMDYSSIEIESIDLDGDKKQEYIVCCTVDYEEGEIGDGEAQASSVIMLFNFNYEKIADLAVLEDGIIHRDPINKTFLSLDDDVEYIDIDNDGIMEIIIDGRGSVDARKISIVKYNNGVIQGETNYKIEILS